MNDATNKTILVFMQLTVTTDPNIRSVEQQKATLIIFVLFSY